MKKSYLTVVLTLAFIYVLTLIEPNSAYAFADSLSETVEEQLKNLDLSALENFINGMDGSSSVEFYPLLKNLLSGEYQTDFNNVFSFIANTFFINLKDSLPTFLTIIAICILCSVINSVKSSFLSQSITEIIFFICFLSVLLLLSNEMISFYKNVKIIMQNMTKLTEIMSPIISTLMVSSGGIKSAAFFTPTMLFFTGGIMNVVLGAVMPLIAFQGVFSVIGNFSKEIKFGKISDFFSSIIKWILGLTAGIYGIFIVVQGVASSNFDLITLKIAKYAISNSVPIIGSFFGSGFDIVVAGSSLIKNSLGIASLIVVFYLMISPILYMVCYSLIMKLTSVIIEPLDLKFCSNILTDFSKTIGYLITCLLMVGFMFFITIMFAVSTANYYL